ncbi:MAG TPA: hypothetical protein DDX71_00840 [Ruminococcus sp.]|nr:hypothetical protein [Ruminococcus sp.]
MIETHKNYLCSGTVYRCMALRRGSSAVMCNAKTGWTCIAHNITERPTGEIDWSHSSEGHFDEQMHLRVQIEEIETLEDSISSAVLDCHCLNDTTKTMLQSLLKRLHDDRWNLTWKLCDAGGRQE